VILVVILLGLLVGCSPAAADHERLGDRAYRESRFASAEAEYRAATRGKGGARLYAKLGAAALHSSDVATAIEAYTSLKEADPSRAAEAAAGLERAAALAARGGASELTHLAAAVRALRGVAPGRPVGRFGLAPVAELDPSEALAALPVALAAATDSRTVDSLLVAYGEAQRITTACEAATHTYAVVLRRARNPGLRTIAAHGTAACALRLGLDALSGAQAELAEHWFEAAVSAAPATPPGWRAAIGLGDARASQGDILGAAIAYQSVLSAQGVPDSLQKLAADKLNGLGSVPPGAETIS